MSPLRTRLWTATHAALFALLCACGGGSLPAAAPEPSILTSALPPAATGVPYEVTLEVQIPIEPGAVDIWAGELPPGLTLDPFAHRIRGLPTHAGTYPLTLRATCPAQDRGPYEGTFVETWKDFVLEVGRGPVRFLTESLPTAHVNRPYYAQLEAIGGDELYVFSTGAGVPPGIDVSTGGSVFGWPTSVEFSPYAFEVHVTDHLGEVATRLFTVAVEVLPLRIATTSLPVGAAGWSYGTTLALGSSGSGAGIVWSQVPPVEGETDLSAIGLVMRPEGLLEHASGSGPTAVGDFRVTLRVRDSAGQQDQRSYDLRILEAPVLHAIDPKRSIDAGPFTAKGLGFRQGTTLTFGPGLPGAVTIQPTVTDSSTLTFATAPAAPGLSGKVTVRVSDPAGWTFDLKGAFTFPAKTLAFSPATILPSPNSPLSSTGVDAGDVDGDGLADVVHCGTSSAGWSNASGAAGGIHLLLNRPAGAAFDPGNPTFSLVVLQAAGDWHQVKLADMNLDGFPDIVAVGGEPLGLRVYLNERTAADPGRAPFTALSVPVESPLPYLSSPTVHVSDLSIGRLTSGDLVPDVAFVHQDPASVSVEDLGARETGGSVTVLRGAPDGTFAELETDDAIQDFFSAASLAVGRFGTDDQDDIAVGDQCVNRLLFNLWLGVPFYLGTPGTLGYVSHTDDDGTIGPWSRRLEVPGGSGVLYVEVLGMAAGRVTGRTLDDVVLVNGFDSDFGRFGGSPGLVLCQNNGSGTSFTAKAVKSGDTVYRYVTLLDADLDGDEDVAVTGGRRFLEDNLPAARFNSLHVYRSSGSTGNLTLTANVTVAAPPAPGVDPAPDLHNVGRVAAGDFNGDGFVDLVLCLSFFAQAREDGTTQRTQDPLATGTDAAGPGSPHTDRGPGTPSGVAIILNASR